LPGAILKSSQEGRCLAYVVGIEEASDWNAEAEAGSDELAAEQSGMRGMGRRLEYSGRLILIF